MAVQEASAPKVLFLESGIIYLKKVIVQGSHIFY